MAIDATISGTAANSYLTDVQFTAYAAGSLAASRMASSTTDTRERALRTATRMLNRLTYQGWASVIAQALQWPRVGVMNPDRDGFLLSDTAIPQRVQDACAELAIALLAEGEVSPDGGLSKSALYSKAKVDVIEVEYRESGAAASSDAVGVLRRYPAVWALLSPLTESMGALEVARA
jgi:hypothetical protein